MLVKLWLFSFVNWKRSDSLITLLKFYGLQIKFFNKEDYYHETYVGLVYFCVIFK